MHIAMKSRRGWGIIVIAIIAQLIASSAFAQTEPTTEPVGAADVRLPAGKDRVTLKLARAGNELLARGFIGGQDVGWFIVDTGCSCSVIDETMVEKFKLRVIGRMRVAAAGRKIGSGAVICLPSFGLGNGVGQDDVVMSGGAVIAMDMRPLRAMEGAPVSGFIGNDILGLPFSLDFREDSLTIYARNHLSPRTTQPQEARLVGDIPLVRGEVEGRKGWFELDTGDNSVLTAHATLYSFEEPIFPGRKLVTVRAFGMGGQIEEFKTRFARFRALGHEWSGIEGTLETAEFTTNLLKTTSAGTIGAKALNDARLSADYRNQQIWVEWPAPETAADRARRLRDGAGHSLDGETALMRAADEGRDDVLRILLANGVKDINAADSSGFTAVHAAQNHSACLQQLIDKGVNVNAQAAVMGLTALIGAAEHGNAESIKMLLDAGAKPNLVTTLNETALFRAVEGQQLEIVEQLLKAGADVSLAKKGGETPLMLAAERGDEAIAKLLLDHKADVNQHSNDGQTALMAAADRWKPDMMRLLLSHGAQIAPRTISGTVLHTAAASGDPECVDVLLKAGADPSVKNNVGKTAARMSRRKTARSRWFACCWGRRRVGSEECESPVDVYRVKLGVGDLWGDFGGNPGRRCALPAAWWRRGDDEKYRGICVLAGRWGSILRHHVGHQTCWWSRTQNDGDWIGLAGDPGDRGWGRIFAAEFLWRRDAAGAGWGGGDEWNADATEFAGDGDGRAVGVG